MPWPTPPHLTQRQLAERWGISERTLEKWRWAGRGPGHIRLGQRSVIRYPLAEVEKYEAEHRRSVERP